MIYKINIEKKSNMTTVWCQKFKHQTPLRSRRLGPNGLDKAVTEQLPWFGVSCLLFLAVVLLLFRIFFSYLRTCSLGFSAFERPLTDVTSFNSASRRGLAPALALGRGLADTRLRTWQRVIWRSNGRRCRRGPFFRRRGPKRCRAPPGRRWVLTPGSHRWHRSTCPEQNSSSSKAQKSHGCLTEQ